MTSEECVEETMKHIRQVQKHINVLSEELLARTPRHDTSKMLTPELEIFMEYTPKLANSTYGSDEYKVFLKEMQVALKHHYEHNQHHPEHFKDGVKGMTLIDVMEMLCDWKAATLRHKDGDILKSIELNHKRFGFSEELKSILTNTVKSLHWEGREVL